MKHVNLGAGPSVAIREHTTDSGSTDYPLFLGRNAVGVIGYKRDNAGENITSRETQNERYTIAFLTWCTDTASLRFLYEGPASSFASPAALIQHLALAS